MEEVVGFQGLLESEEVLGLVVAFEGFGDLFFAFGAAGVAVLGEFEGVVLAGDDVTEDSHTGLAGDVGDDVGEFEVHQLEGFLHMLDFAAGASDEVVAVAGEVAEGADFVGWAEGGLEEAVGVELLDPLAVEDVGFAAGDVLDVAGVNEEELEATGFEDFVDGDPVDAGGFHSHGGDATVLEPVGEGMEVAGEGLEDADGGGVAVLGDGSVDFIVADVEAGGVEVDLVEGLEGGNGLRGGLLLGPLGLGTLWHDTPYGCEGTDGMFRPDEALGSVASQTGYLAVHQ